MKPGLRRIEATLNQLHAPTAPPGAMVMRDQIVSNSSDIAADRASNYELPAPRADSPTYSFTVRSTPTLPHQPPLSPRHGQAAALTMGQSTDQEIVRPFPIHDSGLKALNLPKPKVPSFSNHRHAVNPGFAMGLLREMEGIVAGWQRELQQVLLNIQEIYLEGPIVDGWLESDTLAPRSPETATLRHADVDQLADYIQQICATQPPTVTQDASRAGYRLCGLDADGQLWSRPCPPEQVPQVGLAIARYQKLRQLLRRQQQLESQLSQFSQDLIELHGRLQ